MKQILDVAEYGAIVEKYRQKGCKSNDYIQQEAATLVAQGGLFAECETNNAFLYVKKPTGLRLYYYINDLNEKKAFDNVANSLVIEILFRGSLPQEEIDYFVDQGFHVNLVRDQYAGMYKDLSIKSRNDLDFTINVAQTLDEVRSACELFNSSFDALSGDFIPEKCYENLLINRRILIAQDKKNLDFLGALHQTKEGLTNVIAHVAVRPEARGKGVGKTLVESFIEQNMESEKTRYQLWVQRQNEPAVNMYQSKGFKFINKSTISLIKQR